MPAVVRVGLRHRARVGLRREEGLGAEPQPTEHSLPKRTWSKTGEIGGIEKTHFGAVAPRSAWLFALLAPRT